MDFWSIPRDAIRAAAARKAALPLWRIGAVSITSGLWATAQVLEGPRVTVYPHDVHLEDARTREPAS